MDESYLHRDHHGNTGLGTIDEYGNVDNTIKGAIRTGLRMCIIDGICCFGDAGGHMVAYNFSTGKWYRFCEFRKQLVKSNDQGAHWTELDEDGNDRHAKKKKYTKAGLNPKKKDELKMIDLDVDIEDFNIADRKDQLAD